MRMWSQAGPEAFAEKAEMRVVIQTLKMKKKL